MNPNNSQEALSQLQQTQQQALDPNAYLTQQNQNLGVGAAQETVKGLRGAIDNTTKLLKQVAPSVMGRTQNSLVTSAQAGRQIQNEQAPIADSLTTQGNQYNQAASDLSGLQSQAQQAASGQYQGQQDKISYLQNIYNQLYGREQDASTAAEQKRQYDTSLAEQQRQANMKGSSGNGGYDLSSLLGGLSGQTSDPVAKLFQGYNPATDRGYTENVVIKQLVNQGYTPEQASKLAYDYRKLNFQE